jgi:hypothetical protein
MAGTFERQQAEKEKCEERDPQKKPLQKGKPLPNPLFGL